MPSSEHGLPEESGTGHAIAMERAKKQGLKLPMV